MLQFLFNKLLMLSISFAAVLLIFIGVFWIFKSTLTAKQKYYLLILPLLLCLIPMNFGFNSNVKPVGQISNPQIKEENMQTNTPQPLQTTQIDTTDTVVTQEVMPTVDNKFSVGKYIQIAKDNLVYAWILFAFAIMFYKMICIIKFKRILKQIAIEPTEKMKNIFNSVNKSKRVKLKCFDGVSTPFITGIFKPTVFMPSADMSEYEFCMALKHELTHIKRHDLVIKTLADFTSVIHFFNPFVYVLKNKINAYCELSCDEAVTKNMDAVQCKDYGKMLLSLMKQRNLHLCSTACLSESQKNIKLRMEIIMKKNKIGKFSAVISMILATVLTFSSVALASAISGLDNSQPPKATYQSEVSYIKFTEKNAYEINYTKNGVATFTNFMGRTVFQASYFGMPEELQKKANKLADEEKFDESNAIFSDINSCTDYYELEMDKKIRSYGDGFGLEGLFTLTKNDEIVFEKKTGYLNFLPPCQNNYSETNKTNLVIEFMEGDKTYTYNLSARLYTPTPEQAEKNRIFFANMDKSRQTRKVLLGEIVEAIDNGNKVDTAELNNKLIPKFDDKPWLNNCTSIEYNQDMQLAQAVFPIEYRKHLSLWRGEKVTCDNDTIKGNFKVMNDIGFIDSVPMTVSGLSNPVGGFVEIKSNDGKYYAKYKIVPEIYQPLTVKGTKEVAEFMVEGENVFVGTPREQDEFDRDEHDVFYKRIITDDFGKVMAVVPIEYQQGENIVQKDGVYYKRGQSWQQLFGQSGIIGVVTDKNGNPIADRQQMLLQDYSTWWIKAIIPLEYQFYEEIK